MPPDSFLRLLGAAALACSALSGCATASAPGPAPTAEQAAAEQARRDERQKIMQEYWREQTEMAGAEAPSLRPLPPTLLGYPAGVYDGLAFGPRNAADPSLAEPPR